MTDKHTQKPNPLDVIRDHIKMQHWSADGTAKLVNICEEMKLRIDEAKSPSGLLPHGLILLVLDTAKSLGLKSPPIQLLFYDRDGLANVSEDDCFSFHTRPLLASIYPDKIPDCSFMRGYKLWDPYGSPREVITSYTYDSADPETFDCRNEESNYEDVKKTMQLYIDRWIRYLTQYRDVEEPDDASGDQKKTHYSISLNETERKVADYIRNHPGRKGAAIASNCNTSEGSFRRIHSQKLKHLGYINIKGRGYFAPCDV